MKHPPKKPGQVMTNIFNTLEEDDKPPAGCNIGKQNVTKL